jgi:hypothetical protein
LDYFSTCNPIARGVFHSFFIGACTYIYIYIFIYMYIIYIYMYRVARASTVIVW